jgi:hypothetical protein
MYARYRFVTLPLGQPLENIGIAWRRTAHVMEELVLCNHDNVTQDYALLGDVRFLTIIEFWVSCRLLLD